MICEPDLDLIAESKECFGNVEGGEEVMRGMILMFPGLPSLTNSFFILC